jgi:hypothetical protein
LENGLGIGPVRHADKTRQQLVKLRKTLTGSESVVAMDEYGKVQKAPKTEKGVHPSSIHVWIDFT